MQELDRLTEFLETFAEKQGIDSATAYKLVVCLDELATNVISYGGPRPPEDRIRITVDVEGEILRASIEGTGAAFNPLDRDDPNITGDVEARGVGGLGIFLVKKMMDGVEYERRGNQNVLRMFKHLKTVEKSES